MKASAQVNTRRNCFFISRECTRRRPSGKTKSIEDSPYHCQCAAGDAELFDDIEALQQDGRISQRSCQQLAIALQDDARLGRVLFEQLDAEDPRACVCELLQIVGAAL